MTEKLIPEYPDTKDVSLEMRPLLDPLFKALAPEISEFAFANIYLFRKTHNYRVSRLNGNIAILGNDRMETFFILPFGLPDKETLVRLFRDFSFMKCVDELKAKALEKEGYRAVEDRDNFDYLYRREDLSALAGRRFHSKKNLVNYFTGSYKYEGRPLLDTYIPDALKVLDEWRVAQSEEGDYAAAKEALERCDELQLCGGIYYVEDRPAAYALGEELNPSTFVLHFEKGAGDYKGLLQFVNRSFAQLLPQKYEIINREQDLGVEGLRKSKLSYNPSAFVKKYRVYIR